MNLSDNLSLESLPKINPLKIKEETKDIFDFVNSMPEISDEDNIY